MSGAPKVWLGEARTLSLDDFEALIERERQEERAEEIEVFGHPGTRLTVTIAVAINPVARVDGIEAPLADALGERGIVWGGGSFMRETDGAFSIAEVDVGVSVADEVEGRALISHWLEEHGYGACSRIKHTDDE